MSHRILGIIGSYRKGGMIDQLTSAVLESAAEGGADTEKIYLLDQHIEFCTNCRQCTQPPGAQPGPCPLNDDMASLVSRIEAADGLVLGAPVNFAAANALTQRFLERLVGFAHWPWGQPAPTLRREKTKAAVLITSAAMPALAGRFSTGSLRSMKLAAAALGCRTVGTLFAGMAAAEEQAQAPPGSRRRAQRLGRRLLRL